MHSTKPSDGPKRKLKLILHWHAGYSAASPAWQWHRDFWKGTNAWALTELLDVAGVSAQERARGLVPRVQHCALGGSDCLSPSKYICTLLKFSCIGQGPLDTLNALHWVMQGLGSQC